MRPGTISRDLSFFWSSHISLYLEPICQSHSLDASFIPGLDQFRTLSGRLHSGFDFQIGNQGTSCAGRRCILPFHRQSWNPAPRYQRRAWYSGNSVWFGGRHQRIHCSRPHRQSHLCSSSNKLSFKPVLSYLRRSVVSYRFFVFLRSSSPVRMGFYAPSRGFYCQIPLFLNAIHSKTPFTWHPWRPNLVERATPKVQWRTLFRFSSSPRFPSIHRCLLRRTGRVLLFWFQIILGLNHPYSWAKQGLYCTSERLKAYKCSWVRSTTSCFSYMGTKLAAIKGHHLHWQYYSIQWPHQSHLTRLSKQAALRNFFTSSQAWYCNWSSLDQIQV